MRIRHIYLSPGHNFFGHFGQPPGTHPMHEVQQVRCVAGKGLEGDRFFEHQENYLGQATFFDFAVFTAMCRELNAHVPPSAMRRNIVTEGTDLNQLIDQTFELDGVTFEGAEECRPCAWMDEAVAPGAHAWLKGRGGLRARILTDGVISAAAPVT